MKPNKTRLRKWVAALRSGKYKQGTHGLRPSKDTRCCLGVACDVYRKETGKGRWSKHFDGPWSWVDRDGTIYAGVLPASVTDWFGLPDEDPDLILNYQQVPATTRNDDLGESFEQIAEAIERTFDLKVKRGK